MKNAASVNTTIFFTENGKPYMQFDHLNSNYFLAIENGGKSIAVWTTLKGRRAGGLKVLTRAEFVAKYTKFDSASIFNSLVLASCGNHSTDNAPSL